MAARLIAPRIKLIEGVAFAIGMGRKNVQRRVCRVDLCKWRDVIADYDMAMIDQIMR